MIHKILIKLFLMNKDLFLLKEEIETFNLKIKLLKKSI